MTRCTKCGYEGSFKIETKGRELTVRCHCGNTATYKKLTGRAIEMNAHMWPLLRPVGQNV